MSLRSNYVIFFILVGLFKTDNGDKNNYLVAPLLFIYLFQNTSII